MLGGDCLVPLSFLGLPNVRWIKAEEEFHAGEFRSYAGNEECCWSSQANAPFYQPGMSWFQRAAGG